MSNHFSPVCEKNKIFLSFIGGTSAGGNSEENTRIVQIARNHQKRGDNLPFKAKTALPEKRPAVHRYVPVIPYRQEREITISAMVFPER
jgi:hypothetical protein